MRRKDGKPNQLRQWKSCGKCGKLFLPKSARSVYCQDPCKPPRTYRPRACTVCGTEFEPRGSRDKYCDDCNPKKQRAPARQCKTCGTEFQPMTSAAYCSPKCKPTGNGYGEKECARCGAVFKPNSASRIYCSDECYERYWRPRPCIRCGTEYVPESRGSRFCSEECRELNRADANRRGTQKHMARRRGLPKHEAALAVWAREDMRGEPCDYCGKPNDGTFDVDHVVPLAKGGTDHWTNLVPACQCCNRRKSARYTADEFRALLVKEGSRGVR